MTTLEQLLASMATGSAHVISAVQVSGSADSKRLSGTKVKLGASGSLTITSKLAWAWLPSASSAV